jgi:trk system potassium uptake protein TrkH
MDGLMKFLVRVFVGTFLVEGFGALIYMITFIPQFGLGKGIWYAVFTAISAFCNAGIDILGPDSLISYNNNPLLIINTIFLIVMGGLGYVVWFDVCRGLKAKVRKKYSFGTMLKRLSEHTKLVFSLTLMLILSGAVIVFAMEYNNPDTIGDMSMGGKILNSIFQSVTFRTAGFAAVPQQSLTDGTCAAGLLYMFVGGSPVGTAGGVKTVTLFLVILNGISFIRNRNEVVIFKRRVSKEMMQKAAAILMVSFFITFLFLLLLLLTNDVNLVDASYEIFSATATVGLSRALTPTLNAFGKVLIIVSMYLGRIGPISMALFFSYKGMERNSISYAEGRYFVG